MSGLSSEQTVIGPLTRLIKSGIKASISPDKVLMAPGFNMADARIIKAHAATATALLQLIQAGRCPAWPVDGPFERSGLFYYLSLLMAGMSRQGAKNTVLRIESLISAGGHGRKAYEMMLSNTRSQALSDLEAEFRLREGTDLQAAAEDVFAGDFDRREPSKIAPAKDKEPPKPVIQEAPALQWAALE